MQKVILGKQIASRLIGSRFISQSSVFFKKENEPPVDMVDIEDKSVPIPHYEQKIGESLELQKARLLYQSRKRGMLENGLLLSTFAAKYLKGMNAEQTKIYDTLINQPTNDWDIFYWATNVKPTPDEYNTEMMDLLKRHVSNVDKETRFRQPDLYQQAM